MTLSDVAIRRPILTWMMTLALIVFGLLGYQRLGIDQFPTMEFPVLTVTATLEGATPEGIEEDVTDVLEEQLATIAGVRSLESVSARGYSQVVVEFTLGTDLDIVSQEVRDKVAAARRQLPEEMNPPAISKFNPNESPVLWIPFEVDRPLVEASEYIRRQVIPLIETIPGVAGAQMFGRLDRNIRIWLNGEALRARGLTASDVVRALRREHVETPGGRVESQRFEYAVKTDAEFRSLEELAQLVVAHVGGAPVRLRDVGRVEDGQEDVKVQARFRGRPSIGIGVLKQSGGNSVAIVDAVRARLDAIDAVLPDGIAIHDGEGFIDFSRGVREAVSETEFALIFGALLAVFVVFVFLRRTRPTLIVAAAIPISLITTFGVVYLAGFTLNTMTLLGMALAVGVVIDDAIVVLENIERHRERGETAWDAASTGTREIAFAAAAATISIAAIFLPVVFVEGLVGNFLGDFGLTVASAVLISLFVALTLTPMLAARMPPPAARAHGSIYLRLERAFGALESGYRRLLYWTLDHRLATVSFAGAAVLGALGVTTQLEQEFFPPADAGIFLARLQAAPGTSLEATLDYLRHDEQWLLEQEEIAGLFSAVGSYGGGDAAARVAQSNRGLMFGSLKPREQRSRSVMELIEAARAELQQVPGRDLRIYNPASMMSGGSRGGFEVQIRGHLPLAELDRLARQMIARLETLGGFADLHSSLELGLPEVRVVPDRGKAAALGVDAGSVAEAVQIMIGGMDVGIFKEEGRRYDIRMRLDADARADPESIGKLYVGTRAGGVVELRNLVKLESGAAASAITRTDRQRSVQISANLSGRTLGDAVVDARRVAAEILPDGVLLELGGEAEAMQEGEGEFALALALGVLVIYMVLAAQFESLVHPFTVMLALPLAMVGALGGLWLAGHTLNLFSMIGILLLFGLVTKNSILLVDYANQLRARGMDKREAMRTAAPVRMRPVLMTAFSMIFGVLPAALGIGPGGETRAPMGVATAAGMFSSTLLTLVVVPVFYLLFDDAAEAVKGRLRRLAGRGAPAEGPGLGESGGR